MKQEKKRYTYILVFVILLALTQLTAYQKFLLDKDNHHTMLTREVNVVRERLMAVYNNNLSAARILAYIIKEDLSEDFERVARSIIETNRNIDAIQLTRKGVITHMYPPTRDNLKVIGYNILADSLRRIEALKAISRKELFFAGPFELKQGGVAVVGRLPIFINEEFWGFSAVIVGLDKLLVSAGLPVKQDHPDFIYQLSKLNPSSGKEEFFLPGVEGYDVKNGASTFIADGAWKVYVIERQKPYYFDVVIFSLLGLLLSVSGGLFAYRIQKQPQKLKRLINEKSIQLSTSERYFQSLIEKSSDAIMLLERDGTIIYQSPATERINGYSLEEVRQKKPWQLIHPGDITENMQRFRDFARTPGKIEECTYRLRHKDGHYIYIEGAYTNLLHDPVINAIVLNYHDVTKRTNAELESKQVSERLVQRNTDLQQFAYIISHNLRAPVCNIIGLSNLLKGELPAIEREQALQYILQAVEELDSTIFDLNKILEIRSETGQNREQVSFAELVNTVRISLDGEIKSSHATLITDFSGCESILTVKSYVLSVFFNLVSNSIKYRDPKKDPLITISSYKDNGKIRLLFKDNCEGIDLEKYGNQLFGMYKRFHTEKEGKGLGLYMVKTQVDALGGSISVSSQPGSGTAFTIELPG